MHVLLSTAMLASVSISQLQSVEMVDLRTHLKRAAKTRWAKATQEEKSATMQHASSAYWASMTPQQRSAEMKRRAVVRAENAKKKARAEARAKKKTKK
jgi:hypothetical protein